MSSIFTLSEDETIINYVNVYMYNTNDSCHRYVYYSNNYQIESGD